MADIEFFFDPICPFAWITSRWVHEVADEVDLDVRWRYISLRILNSERDDDVELPPEHSRMHSLGTCLLRLVATVERDHPNELVGRLYTELGTRLHTKGVRRQIREGADPLDLVVESLAAVGLPASLASATEDASVDELLAAETDLAISRTGDDVGTPIITWDLARPETSSFFGPVLSRIPRGEEAVRIYESVRQLALTPGMAEIKRSLRDPLDFD